MVIDRDWLAAATPEQPQEVELLVLKDAPRVSLAELQLHFKPRYWICDGSNYPAQVERWQTEAAELALDLHRTRQEGAFILDF